MVKNLVTDDENMKKISIYNKGFTLIEVLVASVILFASIAMVSMVFRGAFISSEKAEQHVEISSVLPSLLSSIRESIRIKSNSTAGQIIEQGTTWGVIYSWEATLLEFKNAPEKLDVDSGNYITPPKKYKLWKVRLVVTRNSLSKTYIFNELGWTSD